MCNFENDLCHWESKPTQSDGSKYSWQRNNSVNFEGAALPAPPSDHRNDREKKYILASGMYPPDAPNDATADLLSPYLKGKDHPYECFGFWVFFGVRPFETPAKMTSNVNLFISWKIALFWSLGSREWWPLACPSKDQKRRQSCTQMGIGRELHRRRSQMDSCTISHGGRNRTRIQSKIFVKEDLLTFVVFANNSIFLGRVSSHSGKEWIRIHCLRWLRFLRSWKLWFQTAKSWTYNDDHSQNVNDTCAYRTTWT